MKVLVTGGGTVAPIDDVRRIANDSTGRFSAAITEAFLRRGARVRHVHAPGAASPIRRELEGLDLDVEPATLHARLDGAARRWREHRDRLELVGLDRGTVADYAETLERLLRLEPADVIVLAAAVSDFEPEPAPGKIDSGAEELVLRCRRTPKVIRSVRDWAPGAFLVGFKLGSGSAEADLIARAREAIRVNRADLIVANDLRSYRSGRHAIQLVAPDRPVESFGPGIGDLAEPLVERIVALAREKSDNGSLEKR